MSLQKKLTRWKEENLLTQEQCEKILTFERKRTGNTFWRTAFIIAGLLIGLGICLLVASNWDTIGSAVKLVGDFTILGALFYTAWWCFTHQKKGLSELFTILSFLMIGATIGLIGQIFNLEGGWRSFALVWALLGLPFVVISRSLFFNITYLCLLLTGIDWQFWENILDCFFRTDVAQCIAIAIGTYLLSFAGKKLDNIAHKYTLLPKALEKLMMWLTYCAVWGMALQGVGDYHWKNKFFATLLAVLFAFAFFALRLFTAVRTQNLTSFRRNAILVEIYIFILFAGAFSNLFMSGIGFILGGLSILGMIYVFRRTSRYIKTMEIFK
ncbi:MAG: DUF2157 domain-containing protein [Elusimicrobiaceae bacterium]|nr:DUF2157 domain-containing protein [Elusimicrobiaceae bacterium]